MFELFVCLIPKISCRDDLQSDMLSHSGDFALFPAACSAGIQGLLPLVLGLEVGSIYNLWKDPCRFTLTLAWVPWYLKGSERSSLHFLLFSELDGLISPVQSPVGGPASL